MIPPGNIGILHTGVTIGKDRNTEPKMRKTLGLLCFLFWDGWTRDKVWRGGNSGGVGGGGVSNEPFMEVVLV